MQRFRLPLSVPSVLRVLVLVAVGVGVAVPATSTGAPESPPGVGDARPGAKLPGEELEALRTRTSSTYRTDSGERVTRVFGQSVNYRDGQGRWQKIDRKMSATTGGFENGANRFGLKVPRELAGGLVRVTEDGRSFGFGLRQAKGGGAANGASVRFDDALPGVDVTYEAGADAVKETLELAGPSAQSTFEFPLELSAGLRPRMNQAGGVDVVDGRGDSVFSVHPPVMWDSAPQRAVSNALRYELAGDPGNWVLRLVVDRSWLSAPQRRFPVVVDPTVSVGASPNCFVASTFPNGDFCPTSYLLVGQGSGGRINRSLLKFDLSAIEKDALVLGADLALRNDTGGPRAVDAHRLTRSWTDNTTWNKYDGVNNWTTAGGDFDATVAHQNASVGGGAAWEHWYVPDLVQKWVDGREANHGLLLKAANEGTAGDLGFSSSSGSYPPYLEVRWTERLGLERQFSFESQQLSDRLDLNVNIGNGNMILRERDLQLPGTGMDLVVERFYNSLSDMGGVNGLGWGLGTSRDVMLEESDGGKSVLFYGPRSELVRFQRNADASYRSPTAIDAKLERNQTTGEYTLTYTKTLIKLHFDADGLLQRQTDRNNNEISFDYNTSPPGRAAPGTITETQGREINFDVNSQSRVERMTDNDGREWNFDYQAVGSDPTKALDDYTNPLAEVTDYDWTGSQISELTLPGGDVVKVGYDGQGRVDEIIRVTNPGAGTGPTTTFAYSGPTAPCNSSTDIAKTIVTNPRGKNTTYCFDRELRATKVVDPLGHTQESTYTANSDPDVVTAPGSAQTDFGYQDDNLTSLDQPAGEQSGWQYGRPGLRFPTVATTPQGIETNLAYDTVGNLTAVSDDQSPASVEAKLEYNGQSGGMCTDVDDPSNPGTIRCAVDGESHITRYEYDQYGNLNHIIPELPLGETTITYTDQSHVHTVEDGKGQTRTYTYDMLDRVTRIEYSNGQTIDYTYDEKGNMVERDDSVHGLSTYTYDELNRRTHDDLPSGDTDYSWDATSNLATLTDPGGTVTYGYDDANRLSSLAEPGGSCTSPVSRCTTFGYTERDKRNSTVYPNGVTQSVTYDSSNKVKTISAVKAGSPPTTLTSFTYDYARSPSDESDLLQWVRDKSNNRTTYTYDPLGRLKTALEKANDGTGATLDSRTYNYDRSSNISSWVLNGATTTFRYNRANQLCWYVAGTSANGCGSPPAGAQDDFDYDANGNALEAAGWDFTYNIRDQTTSWNLGSGTTNLGYAGPNQTERTSLGGTTQHNTLLGLTREGTTSWTRDPDGTLISQNVSGTRHYYLTDRLGSIVGLGNSSGTLAHSYKYDPYGAILSSTGSVANPFQYTGAYRTPVGSVGIYHMGARYYAAGLARWTQQDPIELAGDLRNGNRYVYAGSDPINLTDPAGLLAGAGPGNPPRRRTESRECYAAKFGTALGAAATLTGVAGGVRAAISAGLGVGSTAVGVGSIIDNC